MSNSFLHAGKEIRPTWTEDAQSSAYSTLLYTVFQQPKERDRAGTVVAISSANSGEGVSYVARALVKELAKSEFSSIAGLNARFLRKLHEPTIEAFRKSLMGASSRSADNLWEVGSTDTALAAPEGRGPWEGNWQYRRDCIKLLREEFDHTVIDCPSLKESGDLLSVAPFVDGIILVIEANRTRKEQLWRAEQRIAAVKGKIIGYVLNKRTYEVPGWIYRRL